MKAVTELIATCSPRSHSGHSALQLERARIRHGFHGWDGSTCGRDYVCRQTSHADAVARRCEQFVHTSEGSHAVAPLRLSHQQSPGSITPCLVLPIRMAAATGLNSTHMQAEWHGQPRATAAGTSDRQHSSSDPLVSVHKPRITGWTCAW